MVALDKKVTSDWIWVEVKVWEKVDGMMPAWKPEGMYLYGLVIAVEPIICETPSDVYEDEDGWTIRTANGCLAAHYEHTIVIRDGRPEILTAA